MITASYEAARSYYPPLIGIYAPSSVPLPSHCIAKVKTATSADSSVIVEIWLPDSSDWNHKILGTGNGGYSSALSYPQMAEALSKGYVVSGSDTGHQGGELDFGVGHPEKIRDWSYRSTHVLAEDTKKLTQAYYGKPSSHAYFVGCSTGGQQGLSEAQRYPEDFDGIVAGDPGNDRIRLNADFVESWLTTHPADGKPFPASKLPLLNKAAVAACDKQDGVLDEVIEDPSKCSFDPVVLACGAKDDSGSCLTDAEVTMVRRLYSGPVRDSAGNPVYPGWPRGSEAGWGSYLIMPAKPVRVEFWSSWVFTPSTFDVRTFDPTLAVSAARAKLPFVEAIDPDLKAFQKSGGKLLLYHGWADPVVPPEDTIDYYGRAQKVLGATTSDSVRLFMVPGMGHCAGGPGASTFDALRALDQWVNGVVPETIPASHLSDGKAVFTRPLCAYPKVARWNGHDDPTQAASFRCTNRD